MHFSAKRLGGKNCKAIFLLTFCKYVICDAVVGWSVFMLELDNKAGLGFKLK